MMKKITALLLILSLLTACAGCGEKPDVPDETKGIESTTAPAAESQATEVPTEEPTEAPDEDPTEEPTEADDVKAEGITGTFTWDSSSQYNNSICRMKQMDEALIIFELDVMTGSEDLDESSEYVMTGVMLMNEDGTEGIYESDPDAAYPITIQFAFDSDKTGFTVTAEGDCGFDPNGHYSFTEEYIEVSEGMAVELIEQLPTAATSLSGNLGGYTIDFPESLVSGWFYEVNATLDDSGETLASFLVSKDMTCVIRNDEDIEPVLIWGSTQSTLEAKILPDYSEMEDTEETQEGFEQTDTALELPVVSLEFDNGNSFAEGESSTVTAQLPWDLPYTLELESSDPAVLTIEDNVLTGASQGKAVLKASLTVFDSTITYEVPMEVFVQNSLPEDLKDDDSMATEAASEEDTSEEDAVG